MIRLRNAEVGAICRRDILRSIGVGSSLVAGKRAEGSEIHAESAAVETQSGRVRGFSDRGIDTYLGIPYGASTAGAARFQRAQAPKPWTQTRLALQYGPSCPQMESRWHDLTAYFYDYNVARMDEDCLRLNVWTPGSKPTGKRPVMLWLHERGFYGGFGHELKAIHGRNLAERGDVVVVSINHRVNIFGFFNLSNYGAQYADSTNVGLLDCVLALEWVKQNIANFGGDPSNVTIFGQSGGGAKVNHLMAMPSAKGLFHKAIAQSPVPLITQVRSLEETATYANEVVGRLGLNKFNIAKIHELPHQAIQGAYLETLRAKSNGWNGPAADGGALPESPFARTAPELSAEIPLMVGTTIRESGPILDPAVGVMSEDELGRRVRNKFGERRDEVLRAMRKAYPTMKAFDLWHQIDKPEFREAAVLQAARKWEQQGAPVYLYQFAWESRVLDGAPRAFHGSEVAFVFHNTDLCERMTGGTLEARELAGKVCDAWVAFARTGNPNHKILPHWPAFAPIRESTMIFDNVCEVKNAYDREAREALRPR